MNSTLVKPRHPALKIIGKEYSPPSLEEAYDIWAFLGGPTQNRWLLSEPGASAKSRKSVVPEYMLYLMPHKLSGTVNMCPWSTPGCRKTCLVSAGRGAQPNVTQGRQVRTELLMNHPDAFFVILDDNLRVVRKRGGGWVRLNGTSDIPWEVVPSMVALMEKYPDIQFADYTKATVDQRPSPAISNYQLARSVWPHRDDAFDIRDLLLAGERVSMVVDDPSKVKDLPHVVMADDTDEWLMGNGPALGLLKPKGKLRYAEDQFYSWRAAELAIRSLDSNQKEIG